MLVRPGTVELLEEAIKAGADLIGGIDPSLIERDPARHIDTVFGIADRYGVGVDIHIKHPLYIENPCFHAPKNVVSEKPSELRQ